MVYNYEKELIDAIQATDRALSCLYNAKYALRDARDWGVIDMFGGGVFDSLMKQGRMHEAEHHMRQANGALLSLHKEMLDINQTFDINLRLNDLISFADYFFDDFLIDWVVQGRILDAMNVVDNAINYVGWLRNNLQYRLSQLYNNR